MNTFDRKRGITVKYLFVCSRLIADSNDTYHRHLLGILSQDDNGKYSFEYKLGDDENTDHLLLPIFPLKNKIYDDRDTHLLLDDYLPSENDTVFIKTILARNEMSEYDEWEWLKAFDTADDNADTILYETLPNDIICHEDISEYINDSTDADTYDDDDEYENADIDDTDDEIEDIDDDLFVDSEEITSVNFGDDDSDDLADDIFESESDTFDDMLDDLFDDDFDDYEITNDEENAQTVETPAKQPVRIVTKTITKRIKKPNDLTDFIMPPPVNPIDIVQQRMKQFEQDAKLREQQRNAESTSIIRST